MEGVERLPIPTLILPLKGRKRNVLSTIVTFPFKAKAGMGMGYVETHYPVLSFLFKVIGILLILFFPAAAAAQAYPQKPIRLVLPVPPGGGSDIIVRTVSQKLSNALGQQIVVDYRGGTGSTRRIGFCG